MKDEPASFHAGHAGKRRAVGIRVQSVDNSLVERLETSGAQCAVNAHVGINDAGKAKGEVFLPRSMTRGRSGIARLLWMAGEAGQSCRDRRAETLHSSRRMSGRVTMALRTLP
jgi:hypothetical protein